MIGSKSIGSKLALVSALLLPIVVWQLGKQAVGSFQSYQDGKLLQRKNAAANNLIAGVYEILMERLATNNALLADQPAGADSLSEIEKRRSAAVQKISDAFRRS